MAVFVLDTDVTVAVEFDADAADADDELLLLDSVDELTNAVFKRIGPSSDWWW